MAKESGKKMDVESGLNRTCTNYSVNCIQIELFILRNE